MTILIALSLWIGAGVIFLFGWCLGHLVGNSKAKREVIDYCMEYPTYDRISLLDNLYPEQKEVFGWGPDNKELSKMIDDPRWGTLLSVDDQMFREAQVTPLLHDCQGLKKCDFPNCICPSNRAL